MELFSKQNKIIKTHLKRVKLIRNVIFCIDDDYISYDNLISGKYDDQLRIHMNTDANEMLTTLSLNEIQYIKKYIEIENIIRDRMFG